MSGNRTRGVRVTGGNVTNYTNTDLTRLHDSDSLHRWKKLSMFEFSFPGKRSLQPTFHHTVIPWWIYRIPFELRSQASLGSISTVVGDHTGTLSAVCFTTFYSICFLSVFGPTSQLFVSSLFSAPRLNLLYVVCFRPQVWVFCTKSIFGPTSEFLDLVSQLILRDLYRAKYAGSCPRIAQIFPNFPKWNIFLNQKVVIPERFGRVHTTLPSTYY